MKYTKKEINSIYGKVRKVKYSDQEFWKTKKNIALQKLSRNENKFEEEHLPMQECCCKQCNENYDTWAKEEMNKQLKYEMLSWVVQMKQYEDSLEDEILDYW
jgi:hypothetical protein